MQRTLKLEALPADNAEEANVKLAEKKLQYSCQEIAGLLKGRLVLGAFTMKIMSALPFGMRRFACTEIEVEGLSAGAMIEN